MKSRVSKLKTDSTTNDSCCVLWTFLKLLGQRVVESPYNKVTGEISIFQKLYNVRWYIPTNSLLTGVAAFQGCNPAKNWTANQIFLRCFKNFRKFTGINSLKPLLWSSFWYKQGLTCSLWYTCSKQVFVNY